MTADQPQPEVAHQLTFWRSLLAWLGWGRHIAICGADLDAEQPNPPPCPNCQVRTNRR